MAASTARPTLLRLCHRLSLMLRGATEGSGGAEERVGEEGECVETAAVLAS